MDGIAANWLAWPLPGNEYGLGPTDAVTSMKSGIIRGGASGKKRWMSSPTPVATSNESRKTTYPRDRWATKSHTPVPIVNGKWSRYCQLAAQARASADAIAELMVRSTARFRPAWASSSRLALARAIASSVVRSRTCRYSAQPTSSSASCAATSDSGVTRRRTGDVVGMEITGRA